jgi:hypothetical protein
VEIAKHFLQLLNHPYIDLALKFDNVLVDSSAVHWDNRGRGWVLVVLSLKGLLPFKVGIVSLLDALKKLPLLLILIR